ncbi:MAG: DNA adenine methylase, partial [Oscillospiraceae bacterium]|nr:DNA adenine methylase [Oscillospiraceae bacterium]
MINHINTPLLISQILHESAKFKRDPALFCRSARFRYFEPAETARGDNVSLRHFPVRFKALEEIQAHLPAFNKLRGLAARHAETGGHHAVEPHGGYGILYLFELFLRRLCLISVYPSDRQLRAPRALKRLDKKLRYYRSPELLERFGVTKIECLDFLDFLRKHPPSENDFMFLDPPYDSDFSTYAKNSFGKDDQKR